MSSKNKLSIRPVLLAVRDIATPLGLELILCVVLALLAYGAMFYKRFFVLVSGGDSPPPDYFRQLIDHLFTPINNLPFMSSLSGAVLWAVTGIVVYMLAVLLINMGIGVKNISTAVRTNKNLELRVVSLSYELKRSVWIFLTFLYLYWFVKLVRYLFLQFNNDLANKDWFHILLGIGTLSVANYALYIFINLVRLNPTLLSLQNN